jgi:hypothetical protein
MSHSKQQPVVSSLKSEALALERWLTDSEYLTHECRECRQELVSHWQLCISCDIRLATHCPGCGNPLAPAGAYACPCCGFAMPRLVT